MAAGGSAPWIFILVGLALAAIAIIIRKRWGKAASRRLPGTSDSGGGPWYAIGDGGDDGGAGD